MHIPEKWGYVEFSGKPDNLNPDLPEAYYFRAAILKNMGQGKNAIKDINIAIKLDPESKLIPAIHEILNSIAMDKIEDLNQAELTSKIVDLENEVKRLGRLYAGIMNRIASTF